MDNFYFLYKCCIFTLNSYEINPYELKTNKDLIFKGSDILGTGFCLSEINARELIDKNSKNEKVLFKYLVGDDLNDNFTQEPSRWIINFFDWNIEEARKYEECFELVLRNVKPERDNNNREIYRRYWWQYGEKRKRLYEKIKDFKVVLVGSASSKFISIVKVETNIVFSNRLYIIISEKEYCLAIT